ncbi:phosphoenolpyruvate synthase [Dialister invisus]|jgi:pyruvate, water dikinase|uniref:phosphoenolpyruvate synthase n=1 Tax=Dialister invisus TaxID=218538 RepID=UPI003AB3AD11
MMDARENAYVLWFDELRRADVGLVGGKSSSLGELTSSVDVPVPYGYATTANAYRYFMEKTGQNKKIHKMLQELQDVEDSVELHEVCTKIRESICSATMPEDLAEQIGKAYEELAEKVGEKNPFVAVRSSATAEDLPDASFAGQQDTYLNVTGRDMVIRKVKECYASTFTDRAVYYRAKKNFDHENVALSAAVQMMADAKAAGVMFTVNLATGADDSIMIEGSWGLGEYIVQGTVTPDNFVVDKDSLTITSRRINEKSIELIRKEGGDVEERKVEPERAKAQVISDEQIAQLADYAKRIEKHYGCYMDMEWAVDHKDRLWILQARPETVWSKKNKEKKSEEETVMTTDHNVLVKGLPASPGMAAGKCHVITDPKDIDTFKEGEVLVTTMTSPDWVPAMKKAVAIVTDAGGMTCHASIVSRELGIPCVVGTKSRSVEATGVLKTGQDITIDARNGIIYDGIVADLVKKGTPAAQAAGTAAVAAEYFPPTGTRVLMNLGDPDLADKYASLPCDGIGLMREEFIWTTFIHEHPLYLIETGRPEKVVDMLAEGISKVCRALAPRPVVLRFSDFKSGEYRNLKGGDKYEPEEPADLLGWRGASRYYDPKYTDAFRLELKAVRKVREEYGLKNLNCMIPFCRTVDEAEKVTAIMREEGLERGPDFKLLLMAEIPANILLADRFNKFVDGYSIGSNDLTMLILGCDRNNDTVASLFDERNLAIKRAIRHLIKVAHRDGKTVSICGQAPSVYPDFTEFLVKSGIDYVSVNPDMVKSTRLNVARIEQRLMLDAATGRGVVDQEDYEL